MLCYRGFTTINKWNSEDIDQVLRGLYICQMNCDSELKRKCILSLPGASYEETFTSDELRLYRLVVDAIVDFLNGLKKNGTTEFDNPPVAFVVKDDTVYLYQWKVRFTYLHNEIIIAIKDRLKNTGYSVRVKESILSNYDCRSYSYEEEQ